MYSQLSNFELSKYSITFESRIWTLYTSESIWIWAGQEITYQLLNVQSLLQSLRENEVSHNFLKQVIKIKGLYFEIYVNQPDKILFLGAKGLNYEKELLSSKIELGHLTQNILESILNSNIYIEHSEILRQLSKKNTNILNHEKVIQRQQHHLNEINQYLNKYSPSFFEIINNKMLGLICDHDILRIHLLKLIAALPSIEKLPKVIKKSFQETVSNILRAENKLPSHIILGFKFGYFLSKFVPNSIFSASIKFSVQMVAKKLICSEDEHKAGHIIQGLHSTNRACTLDQLGELVLSQEEADAYTNKILHIIENSKTLFNSKSTKNTADLPFQHVSIKTSALTPYFITDKDAFEFVYFHIKQNLSAIISKAMHHHVFINFDAEHYDFRDLTIRLVEKVLNEYQEFKYFSNFGFVLQAYLRDSYQHLKLIEKIAHSRQHRISIRLVKGAYWDQETVQAIARQHPTPQYLNKIETDLQYKLLMLETLKEKEYLQLCIGSHNIEDHCYAEALREELFSDSPIIEHQLLHMTYEPLSVAMSNYGWPVRNYLPFGTLLNGMAYLVRRIMENASQTGVLSAVRHHKNLVNAQNTLTVYLENLNKSQINSNQKPNIFEPIPMTRLFLDTENDYFNINTPPDFDKNNPIKIYQKLGNLSLLGSISFVTKEDVERFLRIDPPPNENWNRLEYRSLVIKKAALNFYLNKFEISKTIVYEAGKTKEEALADVDEAIDFLNYYATISKDFKDLAPLGNFATIAPWNFPIAILCGMTSAALLMGNRVIMKPAEQTSLVGSILFNILVEAGVPQSHFMAAYGDGESIGKTIVEHKLINGIAFTGSKSVGEYIFKKSLEVNQFSKVNRKVISELGGKNAIIICPDAEPDETISGVIQSAFRHAGQKCSACSRVIIHSSVTKTFIERLTNIIQDIIVGPPDQPQTIINPLISQKEKLRALAQAEEMKDYAKKNGETILVDRTNDEQFGDCVGPLVIFTSSKNILDKKHFFNRELFAPFLYITEWSNIDQVVKIFNQTSYALTGGIFSQSEGYISELKKVLLCGNLYINRNITGARVAIEPFGGFKLSGTGPKAGGHNYLLAFSKPKINNEIRFELKQTNSSEFKEELINTLKIAKIDLNDLCNSSVWGQNELIQIPGQINELNYDIKIKTLHMHFDQKEISIYSLALLEAANKFNIQVELFNHQKIDLSLLTKTYPNIIEEDPQELSNLAEFVFIDCQKEKSNEIMGTYRQMEWDQIIPFIQTPNEISNNYFIETIKRLFQVRSIITNTLRYGAPLQS